MTGDTLVVQTLYQDLLLRSPDPAGGATWTGFLDQGGYVPTAVFIPDQIQAGLSKAEPRDFKLPAK